MCTGLETAAVGSLILGTHGAEQTYHSGKTAKRLAADKKKKDDLDTKNEFNTKANAKKQQYTDTRTDLRKREQRGRMSTILGQGGGGGGQL